MQLLGRYPYPLFLLLTCWHGMLFGATLSGVVQEASEALSDVEVMLVSAESGVVLHRAYTDKTGEFSFTVDTGSYNIGAFKHEYANSWRKNIVVKESNVSVQIELVPEAFTDEPSSDDCE
ncbi:MAG: carboxypeptidase-like regulatory domain-containing protein [Candidatus Thiodiazotropha sp.]|nr:carboxypeptidase-like regulatory domain-containing protein [Candidatus Thiodiazotropha sp.]MCM8883971.1 carboxypeptidase-like regulatory domain-containing protein [Candidatus Thiodiazotropha sp.]MCM8922109.1 carboxypeptidase-like regulatory domain-containing protein [Candidatus Thiodiazotropha sp.]